MVDGRLVERGIATLLVCWLMLGAPSSARAEQGPAPSRSGGAGKSLQAKAADPTEPLIQVSIFNDLVLGSRGGTGLANQLLIQPVILPVRPQPAAARALGSRLPTAMGVNSASRAEPGAADAASPGYGRRD